MGYRAYCTLQSTLFQVYFVEYLHIQKAAEYTRGMRVRLKVKELAEQKGISIHRLHLRTEIALSSIRKFYQDPYADIKISTLLRIAEVLDCSICDLFEEEKP